MSLASEVPPPAERAAAPAVMPALAGGGSAAMVADPAVFPHAMFLDRLAAVVLDVFLVLISWQLLWPLRRSFTYHVGFWVWKGTTVGGIICQLRLVRIDGAPLQFVDAFVRGLGAIFSLAVFGLGGLWILKDPDRQAWHDRIAGTFVVKVPRNYPI